MELLPCPFCLSNEISSSTDVENYIGCGNCKTLFVSENNKFKELWNSRHSSWISVKKQKPESRFPVLLTDGQQICIGWFNSERKEFIQVNTWDNLTDLVTNFMLLPETPKET